MSNNTYGNSNAFQDETETIEQRIERNNRYIKNFKESHDVINCYKCNAEVPTSAIDNTSGLFFCNNCNYSMKLIIR